MWLELTRHSLLSRGHKQSQECAAKAVSNASRISQVFGNIYHKHTLPLAGQSTLTTLVTSRVVAMVMITFVLRVQQFPKPPSLPTFVSTLISKATYFGNVNDIPATLLPDDPPGDDAALDDFYPGSESKESESDDYLQDEDPDPELEPAQATDHGNTDEVMDVEDLGPDGSPLFNHAERAEVEESQEPGLQPEIEEFGENAGRPIRVGRQAATNATKPSPVMTSVILSPTRHFALRLTGRW